MSLVENPGSKIQLMSTIASAIANKMKLTLNPSIELLADGVSLSSRCVFCCVDISNPSFRDLTSPLNQGFDGPSAPA